MKREAQTSLKLDTMPGSMKNGTDEGLEVWQGLVIDGIIWLHQCVCQSSEGAMNDALRGTEILPRANRIPYPRLSLRSRDVIPLGGTRGSTSL
jgi:hypothetical protein